MTHHVEVRRGEYRDSVALMLATTAVRAVPGVVSALVAMGTELNLEQLAGLGFEVPGTAGVNDLIVAYAVDGVAGSAGGAGPAGAAPSAEVASLVQAALAGGAPGAGGGAGGAPGGGVSADRPRTVRSALRRSGGALALISTPGPTATVECMDALEQGASAIVFSDNVPLSHERRLKEEARRRGLLVMGPDCGTVVIGGVGYGFANVVPRGPVGVVAASGTGAQQVMALLAAAGVGISHCLGTGGRDLTPQIGGISTLTALTALDADPATELVVVVAKPPAPEVAARVRAHAGTLATPVVFALVGEAGRDLTGAVEEVLRAVGREVPVWREWGPAAGGSTTGAAASNAAADSVATAAAPTGAVSTVHSQAAGTPAARPGLSTAPRVVGLFSGGTLCAEARAILAEAGLAGVAELTDYGDDAYTRGRPHPMIDDTLRVRALDAVIRPASEADGPPPAVILLDVVLGRGATADPAAGLAPSVTRAVASGHPVVVSLCGTDGDPQGLQGQARALAAAGACVFLSNAAAARAAIRLGGFA